MSAKNVTPSGMLTVELKEAIEKQQSRVWQLRSLLQAVHEAVCEDAQETLDDAPSALSGLIELADSIHEALDCEMLEKRAAEILRENTALKHPQVRPDKAEGYRDGESADFEPVR